LSGGDAVPGSGTVGFDPDHLTPSEQYRLIGGTVVPRPIALVTTLGSDGSANAAPFSFFNAVCENPPTVVFSIGPSAATGATKDTLRNLRELPECVVHIVNDAQKERMNICAVPYPRDVSEIERAGFATAASVKVRPPRIVDCPAQLECRVLQMFPVGRMPYHLVVAEVVYFHYHPGVVGERLHVDFVKLDPLGRLSGAGAYARVTDHFRMPIPAIGDAP
jgi:flavin reductase (DIM6/NTAB) family NADH-FMN oxidoreductase RutF